MRLSAFARMHVVQKEEKETRIREFIERDLALKAQEGARAEPAVYRLIALSPESPAAVALSQFSAQLAELGIEIQAVFMKRPVVAKGGDASVPGFNTRFLADPRMLEAHEQLVLGPATVWIGDCMRRDPAKRDAFETYCDLNVPTARSARRSFERMWAMAAGTSRGQGVRRLTDLPGAFLEASLLSSPDAAALPIASRH